MTDNFSRNVMISGAGHLVIVLLIFFRAITMPSERIDLRNAIRVDVVGLPGKMQTLPDKVPDKPAPAPAVKEAAPAKKEVKAAKTHETAVNLKKSTEKAEKRALEKLKALEALEKFKQEVGKEKAKKSKPTAVAGNQVSAGNSMEGITRIDYDRYTDEVKIKVHDQWSIPQWLAEQDLKAEVLVLIDERGLIIKRMLKKPSGNETFDAKAIEAVDGAAPYPAPPQRLRGLLSTSGIVFKFPE